MKIYRKSMAMPTDNIRNKTYYHGTDSIEKAMLIMNNGINPPDVSLRKDSLTRPIPGRVYLTDKIGYAAIYCIGGDMAGSEVPEGWITNPKEGRYGYVFEIDGNSLADIQPDEDSVGEFIYDKKYGILNRIAENHVAPSRLQKVYDGGCAYYTSVGKQIMKYIPDWLKLQMIEDGAHIANQGNLPIKGCWRFDKMKTKLLKRDYSNFFELAERIK